MRPMKNLALLPSLFTMGNGICGFIALLHVGLYGIGTPGADGATLHDPWNLVIASWLIMLGMLFDGVDGKIARMTGSSSEFGAQLDSLCDAVTFGMAPAFMVSVMYTVQMNDKHPYLVKLAWFLSVAFAASALLRLARYNVEQGKPEESYHLSFKGTPTPAAGGLIASLVILWGYLKVDPAERLYRELPYFIGREFVDSVGNWIVYLLPFLAAALAYLMVSSRIYYTHFLNRILKGKRNFDYLAYVLLGGIAAVFFLEITIALAFTFYVFSGIAVYFWRHVLGKGSPSMDTLPYHPNLALIGFGSNVGTRKRNIRTAIKFLRENPAVTITRKSMLYKTKPVGGPKKQRPYLNGALLVQTSLNPRELLETLQEIEEDMGRVRRERWGPRIIDLDILLYGNLIMREKNLKIPHPRMHERLFVLEPAAEIAPKMTHPVKKKTVSELYEKIKPAERNVEEGRIAQ